MSDFKANFWDERYSVDEYIYGTEPNQFFKEEINKISPPGLLFLPGEGEGRNAVYAARLGWKVDAFDQSEVAKLKARKFAKESGVSINYQTIDLRNLYLNTNNYNCAAIIFLHLPVDFRSDFHKKIVESIKPNGKIILELFSKNQFGKSSGGPQDLSMLYSLEEIENDFKELQAIILQEENIILNEGKKHSGEASVIRYVGEKVI
jgi:hypothetical protein